MNTEQLQQCLDHLEDAAFGYVGGAPHGVVESARKSAEKLRAEFAGKVLVPVELLEKKVINKYSDEYSMAFHDGWNELIDDITASQEPKQ